MAGEQAQVDWGDFGTLDVAGGQRRLSAFVMVLSWSRGAYARFTLDQRMDSFLRGHVEAFDAFGGVPRQVLYDNLKSVVLERVGQHVRFHDDLLDFAGHYHFLPRPCAPYQPHEKATVERAFGTVKTILQPLFDITNHLAARLPALSSPELAQAAATVLVAALLRAYQAGARAARRASAQRATIEPEQLARAAREQRELARAHERSSRPILARVHQTYAMPRASQTFVNALRRYAPQTLLEAERRFATQVHRDDIRDRMSYFAAIVRKVAEEHRRTRVREQRLREDDERRERHEREHDARQVHYHDHPIEHLRDALGALADEWLPGARELLLGGRGLGRTWMQRALERLVELHGPLAARDLASAVVRDFAHLHHDRIGPHGLQAVLRAARPFIDAMPTPEHPLDCAARFASAMLPSTGPPARPAPHKCLRT